jgi:hypothetical protein
MSLGARALNQKRNPLHFLCGVTAALANKTNVNTRACADTSGQTTAHVYFQFFFLHQHWGQVHRLLLVFTMTESSEKDYADTKKLSTEMQNILGGYAHVLI